jgi:hypothetical protein
MASLKFRTDDILMLTKSAKQGNTTSVKGNKNKALKPSEKFN